MSEDRLEVVDASKLKDSLSCLQYYRLRHEEGLIPKDKSRQAPLIFGSAIHKALEAFYLTQSLKDACQAFDKEWAAHGIDGDFKRNPATALRILSAYAQQYRRERFSVIATEKTFVLPISDSIAWSGTIDLLAQIEDNIFVMDHKTASILNSTYWTEYVAGASHQEMGYLYAISQLSGRTVRIFAVNAILVSPDKTAFERRFFTKTGKEVEEWRESFLNWWAIVQACRKAGIWPKNPIYCSRWGQCQYLEICQTGMVTDGYIREPWDPIAKLRQP